MVFILNGLCITTSLYMYILQFHSASGFYENQWSYYWLLGCLAGVTMMIVSLSVVCFRICRLTRIGPYCYACCMKGICCQPKPWVNFIVYLSLQLYVKASTCSCHTFYCWFFPSVLSFVNVDASSYSSYLWPVLGLTF